MRHDHEFTWTASRVTKSSDVAKSSSNLERSTKLLKSTYVINKCLESFQDLSVDQLNKLINVVHAEIGQDQELINDFFENAVNVDLIRQNLLKIDDESTTSNAINTITEWLMKIKRKKRIEDLFVDDDLEKSRLNCTNYLNRSLSLVRNRILRKFESFKSKKESRLLTSDSEEIIGSNDEDGIDSNGDPYPENLQSNSIEVNHTKSNQKENQFLATEKQCKQVYEQNSEPSYEEHESVHEKIVSDSDIEKTNDCKFMNLGKTVQNDIRKSKNPNIKIIDSCAVSEKFKIVKDSGIIPRLTGTLPDCEADHEQIISNPTSPVTKKCELFDNSKIVDRMSRNCFVLAKKLDPSPQKMLSSDEIAVINDLDAENSEIGPSEIKIVNSFSLESINEESILENEHNRSDNSVGDEESLDNLSQNVKEIKYKKRKKKKKKENDTENFCLENAQNPKEEIEFFDCGNTITDVNLNHPTKENSTYNSEEEEILDSQPEVKHKKKRVRNIQIEEIDQYELGEIKSSKNITQVGDDVKNTADSASISTLHHFDEDIEPEQVEMQIDVDGNFNDELAGENSLIENNDGDLEDEETQNSVMKNVNQSSDFNYKDIIEEENLPDKSIFLKAEENVLNEIQNVDTSEINDEKKNVAEENNVILVPNTAEDYLEDDITIKDENYFMGESEEYTSQRVSQLKRFNLFDSDDSLSADEILSSQVPVQKKKIFNSKQLSVTVDYVTRSNNKRKNLNNSGGDNSSGSDSITENIPKDVATEKNVIYVANDLEFQIKKTARTNETEEFINFEELDIQPEELILPDRIKSPETHHVRRSQISQSSEKQGESIAIKQITVKSPETHTKRRSQSSQPSENQEENVTMKKITEISDLIECEDWVKKENESTLLLSELQEDDLEIYVLEVPRIAFQGVDLINGKFELSRDMLQLGNMTFRALAKKGFTTTCILKHKKKKFKTANLHPRKYVIASSTIVNSNSNTSEDNSNFKKPKKQRSKKTKEINVDSNEIICNEDLPTGDFASNSSGKNRSDHLFRIDPKLNKSPQPSRNENEDDSSKLKKEVIPEITYNDLLCTQEKEMNLNTENLELNVNKVNKGKKNLNDNEDDVMDERSAKRVRGMKRLNLFESDESDKDDKSNSENEEIFKLSNYKKSSEVAKKTDPLQIIKQKKKKRKLYFEE